MADLNQTAQDTTGDAIHYPRPITIFAAVSAILFSLVGCIGNLLTILALSKCVRLRHATTVFVISLSVADLMFCSINLPLTASRYIEQDWLLGDTLCELFPFFFYGNVGASLLSMTAITINRYVLINHYTSYSRIYRRRNIILMIAFIWCFSFAILIPTLFRSWGRFGYDPRSFSCTILPLNGNSSKKFLFVFGFLLPCIVIVISYACIYIKVHKSGQKIASHAPTSPQTQEKQLTQKSDELRITKIMMIVFSSFLLCFLPLMIVNVFDSKEVRYPTIHVLASVLAWMSSCINPFIYAVMNQQYRHAYLRLLCGKSKHNSNDLKVSTRSGSSICSRSVFMDVFNSSNKKKKTAHATPAEEENTPCTHGTL